MTEPRPSLHLIDEDPEALIRLFHALTEAGFPVSASSDVETALGAVLRLHPDLILCSAQLPKINGRHAFDWLAGKGPGIPMLVAASEQGADSLREEHRGPQLRLVAKPYRIAEVVAAVEDALENSLGRGR